MIHVGFETIIGIALRICLLFSNHRRRKGTDDNPSSLALREMVARELD